MNQNKFPKSPLISSFLITFGILLLILFCLCGVKHVPNNINNYRSSTAIGMYVADILLVLAGYGLACYSYLRILPKFNIINQKLIYIFIFIPVIGLVAMVVLYFIFLRWLRVNKVPRDKTKAMPVVAILFLVTIVVVGLVWLVYSITGKPEATRVQEGDGTWVWTTGLPGVIDILLSPIKGFIGAAEIIVYLFIIGAFIFVINKSKALEAGIGRLTTKMKGKEIILIPILLFLFAIGGSSFGMCEECIGFYAIVMPIILAAGYDAIVGIVVILFGAGLGVCASIINPFMILTSVEATIKHYTPDGGSAPGWISGFSVYDGMIFRIIVFFVLFAIVASFIMFYAVRVKRNAQHSLVYDLKETHLQKFSFDQSVVPPLTIKRKITLAIFALAFVFLILGAIPWDKITGWQGLVQLNDDLVRYFPFLSTGMGRLGAWGLFNFALLFLTGTFIVGIMHWDGVNSFYKDICDGAKDFFNVVVVISLARGIGIIMTNSGISTLIANGIKPMLMVNQTLGIIVMYFVFFLISIFMPSTSGFAFAIFGPIAAPSMITANAAGCKYSLGAGISSVSIANSLVNLCSPTAGPFVIGTELAHVPLRKFYKYAWKLLLTMFLVGLLLLIISQWMPSSMQGQIYKPN